MKGVFDMPQLSPSLLAADFGNLSEQIKRVEESGVEILHLDIMDGHFVPNISFGPVLIEKIRACSKLIFNAHLMIEKPEQYINSFAKAGADIITVHCEACSHLHRTIQNIKENNLKSGVALNPATPISQIEYVLSMVDYVLVMSVNPGFGGQNFIPFSYDKLEKLKEIRDEYKYFFKIEIDGGIDLETAVDSVKSGADILVAGTAVFKNDMIEKNISDFNEILKVFKTRLIDP